MLRIKTRFSEHDYVHTLLSCGKWITISVSEGKTTSTDALNLFDAGRNHLIAAHKVKLVYEQRGQTSATISAIAGETNGS
jgi:hypothetical protein